MTDEHDTNDEEHSEEEHEELLDEVEAEAEELLEAMEDEPEPEPESEPDRYCPNCGNGISAQAAVCLECGADVSQSHPSPGRDPSATSFGQTAHTGTQSVQKDPGVAAVLSFLIAGAGQCYTGHWGRGLAILALQVINFMLIFVVVGVVTYPAVWLWSIVDAHRLAQKHNEQIEATQ